MKKYIDENTFVYFDPPYRPLTDTAEFTAYNAKQFDDKEQIRLANFIKDIQFAKIMESNSDPKNVDKNDNFFDDLYKGFKISRISATRAINSKATARGKINEILITNYEV